MAGESNTAAGRPKGRSLADFPWPQLSTAERMLLERCATGEPARFGATRPTAPSDDNRISPGFLRFLALGGGVDAPVHEKGVQIEGAWIDGTIDFEGCTLPHRLRLQSCHVEGALWLRDAQIVGLNLEETFVRGIVANRLRCMGALLLWRNFQSRGGVLLIGARIDGTFDCEGGKFEDDEVALDCDGAQFGGRVFLNKGFEATGEVRFRVASLARGFDCRNSRFNRPGGVALNCTRVDVVGSAFFGGGFHASGEVQLIGAKLGGDFDCEGGQFENPDGIALNCEGATIGSRVFLRNEFNNGSLENEFRAAGEVRLIGVTIGGDLDCAGARFENAGAMALDCTGIEVGGSVYLRHGLKAEGDVRFIAAKIGADLRCDGGRFVNSENTALTCDGATIGGRTFLRKHVRENDEVRFHATGEVRFIGAKLGGGLDCAAGMFEWATPGQVAAPEAAAGRPASGDVLSCDGAEFGGDVLLNEGFHARGAIRLVGVRVNGDLDCTRGRFNNTDGYAFLCQRAEIKGALFFRNVTDVSGTVSLTAAHVATLADDADSWKVAAKLNLDGFTYDRISAGSPVSAVSRIAWLEKQEAKDLSSSFKPQPWIELARVLYALGHEDDAKEIRMEMRRRWHRSRKQHRTRFRERASWPFAVLFDWLLRDLVGYGYRPWRILAGFAFVYLLGVLIFEAAEVGGVMVPADARTFLTKGVPLQCAADWVGFKGPPVPSNAQTQAAKGVKRARLFRLIGDDANARANAAVKLGMTQGGSATWPDICARAMPPEYVAFSPWLYSLEHLMPVLDLRQKSRWTPEVSCEKGLLIGALGAFVWCWRLMEIIAVLFFSLLLVASVSGIIKKE